MERIGAVRGKGAQQKERGMQMSVNDPSSPITCIHCPTPPIQGLPGNSVPSCPSLIPLDEESSPPPPDHQVTPLPLQGSPLLCTLPPPHLPGGPRDPFQVGHSVQEAKLLQPCQAAIQGRHGTGSTSRTQHSHHRYLGTVIIMITTFTTTAIYILLLIMSDIGLRALHVLPQ